MGTYTKASITRAARPRSERLRQFGGAIVSTSAAVVGGGGYIPSGETHSHANLADLNMITVSDGYIYLTDTYTDEISGDQVTETVKVMAGYADRAGANADGYTLDWFIPVTVNGSLTLKLNPIYAGLWAEGFMTSGGINPATGGGVDLERVWMSLTNNTDEPNVKINSAHIPVATTGSIGGVRVDGTTITIQNGVISATAQGGGGTVNSLTVGSTNYTPDSNGIITIPAYPTTLPASDVYSWAKASTKPSYSLNEINGTDDLQVIEALTGTGTLKRTGTNTWTLDSNSDYLPLTGGALTGNLRLKTGGANYGSKLNFGDGDYLYLYEDTDDHLKIHADKGVEFSTGSTYGIKFGNGVLKWDASNNAWHLEGNFYADGFITAGGIGSSNTQLVTLNGDQTIDGDKTFIGNTELHGTLYVVNTAEFVSEATFDTGVVIGGASLGYSSSKLTVDTDTQFTYATNKSITISSIVSRLEALEH